MFFCKSTKWIAPRQRSLSDWRAPVFPAPRLIRDFELSDDDANKKLTALISGLGFFELYINDRKVGNDCLVPAPSIYDRRWRFRRYDVSAYVRAGSNRIAVILGNGQYNSSTAEVWHFDKATWRDHPKLIFELRQGQRLLLTSDTCWQSQTGPITFDSLRGGEFYDGTIEWSEQKPVRIAAPPGGVGTEETAPACRVVETLAMKLMDPQKHIYESPFNLTGVVRISVRGPRGATVEMQHGELLSEDGKSIDPYIGCYITDGSFQLDKYTLSGDPSGEIYEPRFTYHGFRYVKLTMSEPLEIVKVEARRIQSDFTAAGQLHCSDPAVSTVHRMALNSYNGNFIGLPLDCPHREKNGWTSEAQLGLDLGLYSYDCGTAYIEYLETLTDAMRISGQLPGMVPTSGWGYNWGNGPAYDSALINIAWQLYLFNADRNVLRKFFPFMVKTVDYYYHQMSENDLVFYGLGDWLAPNTKACPSELVSSAFYYQMTNRLAQIAQLLGLPDEASR